MNKKSIIQGLWIGKKLGIVQILCIKSFLQNNHEFHLYTYGSIENIPKGTIELDANEIIEEDKIFEYKKTGGVAGFSDWFRYKLLYLKGGIYVDMDIICLKPMEFEEDIVFGLQSIDFANNAVLKFPKNHSVMKFMVDMCENPNKIREFDTKKRRLRKLYRKIIEGNQLNNIDFGETGPKGLTNALQQFNLLKLGKPFTYFYPISHDNWLSIFNSDLGNEKHLFSNSYAIHLWNEKLRRVKFEVNKNINKYSYFYFLLDKYK